MSKDAARRPLYDILLAQEAIRLHKELPRRLKDTLVAVVSHANRRNPDLPITVYHQTLADQTGACVRTISRHLADLVKLGWLILEQQKRVGQVGNFRSGHYAWRTIQLTPQAIAQTRLDAPPDKMSSRHTGTEITTTKRHPQRPSEKPLIPEELQWLHTEKGMSVPGVLSLMKLANQHDTRSEKSGKRLSDLVEACRDYLKAMPTPQRLYGAIRALALRNTDYTFIAASRRHESQQSAIEQQTKSRVERFAQDYASKTLLLADRRCLQIEHDGVTFRLLEGERIIRTGSVDTHMIRATLERIDRGEIRTLESRSSC